MGPVLDGNSCINYTYLHILSGGKGGGGGLHCKQNQLKKATLWIMYILIKAMALQLEN